MGEQESTMKIHFTCANCQTKYSALPDQAGAKGDCKNCGHKIVVPKSSRMKQKFILSKSNKILYFLGIILLSIGFFSAMSEPTPYYIGKLIGRLIFFLGLPSLFAWIFWRWSGRKEKVRNLTFNIVLMLIFLGQIGQFGNNILQSQKLKELQERKEKFKREMSNAEDTETLDKAYDKFANSQIDLLNHLSETSTGSEKQYYRIMNEFASESQSTVQKWKNSYKAVLSPRILDFSLLNSDKEFDYQRNVLMLYIEKTKVYNELLANMIPDLKKRLSVLGKGNEYARKEVKATTKIHLLQKPIFEPLMRAHIEYGNNMIQILDLLQKNKDKWSYENDELMISSDNVLSKYNELFEAFSKNEATINTLSSKLVEVWQ